MSSRFCWWTDSEGPVNLDESRWRLLQNREKWEKPPGAAEDQLHFMVQCMETWIVADPGAVKKHFGACLNSNKLPALNNLEARSKRDVQKKLEDASPPCGQKRMYRKGVPSFRLLAKVNPAELESRLPHFKRLMDFLRKTL